jgi:Copper binding periplasmic protein CusF
MDRQMMRGRAHQTFWFVVLALPGLFAGCRDGGGSRTGAEKVYNVRGKVVAVNPAKPTVTLDHEDIPGLMRAMRMEFKVEDRKLLEGIKVGDLVQGRLKIGEPGYLLTHLDKQTDQ